jgi:hypothetical protein
LTTDACSAATARVERGRKWAIKILATRARQT